MDTQHWSSGTVAAVLLLSGLVSLAQAGGPPSNDQCANAIEITASGNPVSFSMVGATDDPNVCGTNQVWFRCTAPCSGTMTILLDNVSPPVSTSLGVYSANVLGGCTCPPGGGTFGGGQELECGNEFVSFPVSAGACYIISAGSNPNTASATIRVEVYNTANDECADALSISPGQTSFCTNFADRKGPDTPCGEINNDVWFEYVADCTGMITLSTCEYGSMIAVYGPGPAGFSCPGGDPPFHAVLLGCTTSARAAPMRPR
jgi:hypothetical protein